MCTNPHSKGSLQTCVGLYRFTTKRCTATHCNTLQHTAIHCNTLQHPATPCNTLQCIATHCTTATHCNTLYHTAPHCNPLQHTATHCNTLQHTATRCMTRQSVSLFSLLMLMVPVPRASPLSLAQVHTARTPEGSHGTPHVWAGESL